MKLWELKPNENLSNEDSPWCPWYDKAFGFIIRAETEEAARSLAGEAAGDEEKNAWIDKKYSTCEELTAKGNEEIVLKDFASA